MGRTSEEKKGLGKQAETKEPDYTWKERWTLTITGEACNSAPCISTGCRILLLWVDYILSGSCSFASTVSPFSSQKEMSIRLADLRSDFQALSEV